MSEKIEKMYLVLKWTEILGYLSVDQINDLMDCCLSIREGRTSNGKSENKYLVVNQDEPYSGKIWQMILQGEDAKAEVTKHD